MSISRLKISVRRCRAALTTLLLTVVICGNACFGNAWQRYSGGTIGKGTHDLTAVGAIQLHWQDLPARASRRAELAGPDGYEIELFGPNRYDELLGFSTVLRPSPGTYRVSTEGRDTYDMVFSMRDPISPHGDHIVVGGADSGQIILRSAPSSGLDGSYTVYLTVKPRAERRTHGPVVIAGTFHIR